MSKQCACRNTDGSLLFAALAYTYFLGENKLTRYLGVLDCPVDWIQPGYNFVAPQALRNWIVFY